VDATDLCYMPATDLAAAIRAKRVSPVEVTEAVLARIERVNPRLNAYCTVTAEAARAAAKVAEAAVMRGEPLGPLHGVPVSIKDLTFTKGLRTTRGSKLYEHFLPEEDAPLVERLRAAGAISLGKTNTPEFGWKGVTDNLVFGPSRNPWNPAMTPGGSSGGGSAAVAAGLGPLAQGSDGGGSIRIPCSFCGIFGLKPSFGRVPQYPASAVASLSHAGPMTRTVRDAALMLNVMAGPDERDGLSLPADRQDFLSGLEAGIRGLRVAWSPTLGYAHVHPEVARLCEAAARKFGELGAHVELVESVFEDPEGAWAVLFYAGIGAALGEYLPSRRGDIDPGLVPIIEEGMRITGYQVIHAQLRRAAHWDVVRRFFERFELLLTPTLAVPPFPVGLNEPPEHAGQHGSRLGWVAFTYPFNLTGQPAASVPCGFTSDGLPVGLQIVGRRFADATVLRAAAAFEAIAPWADRRPPIG
jgi:aspartyl-tRNA(Asn)/glutamyl-tRNA(Gln) amidotransferase subunit A